MKKWSEYAGDFLRERIRMHSALGTRHSALGTRHSALGIGLTASLFAGTHVMSAPRDDDPPDCLTVPPVPQACDLHVILPCGGSGEGIGEGSGQAQDASSGGESVSGDEGGPSSTSMSVGDAMSALGFSTPEQFYSWIVAASEEQADAATYVLWTLVEGNS
jgi:hypothetical protein